MQKDDVYYMQQALQEACRAMEQEEVPVGAVVVGASGQILGRGHNLTETLQDVTAHAEVQAVSAAMQHLGTKYLPDCTLYVTLEPCVMCAGVLYWSKLARLVYGASEPKYGYTVKAPASLHPKTSVTAGVLETECAALLTTFFQSKRVK